MKRAILTILSLLIFCALVQAQRKPQKCLANHNAPPASIYHWPPDTVVKVYFIRNMFTPEQRETLFAAMSTWSDAAARMGAGVKFSYQGEREDLSTCNACLTITRREIHKYDRKHYAFFNPLKRDGKGLLVAAWIDFDFATTKPQALQGFMAHELGHGMGLWDCTTCKKKKTIMNGFPGINSDNGLLAPSACDLEVVRKVYEQHRQVATNAASGDGGRER